MIPAVGLVLLAAGGSSRMGRPKQLLPIQGRSLLRRAAEAAAASPCRPIVVVLGAHAAALERQLTELPITVATNLGWEKGIGGSIRAGVQTLIDQADVDALVLLLVDQPFVDETIIMRLVDLHASSGAKIVASAYVDTLGPPALFQRALFPQLLALNDAEGAKRLFLQAGDDVQPMPFPGGQVDLDTPLDYRKLGYPDYPG